jgi:hypothetical protein
MFCYVLLYFAFNIIGRNYVTEYNFENIMNLINIFYKL